MSGDSSPSLRVGSRTGREPQEVMNRRKQICWQVGYEPRIEPDATIDDLDLELVGRHLHRTPLRGRDPVEALEHYQLIVRAARGWRVTNAALLLFASGPVFRWHPRAGIRMSSVSGRQRRHGPRRNVQQLCVVQPPLAAGLPEAIKIAGTHVRRTEKLVGMRFDCVPEYPAFAWEEAIVNAVAHRDYEVRGREIEIWFYDDHMEVNSPGGLLPEVTEERLLARLPTHVSRNPLLVRVLADADFMREEGEGILRIHEEMEQRRLPPPEIEAEDWLFTIRLFNHESDRAAKSGADVIREPRVSMDVGGGAENSPSDTGAGTGQAGMQGGGVRSAETRPVRRALPSDIDLSVVLDYAERSQGVVAGGERSLPTNEALLQMGILTSVGGELRPTVFGSMAFGRAPQLRSRCASFLVTCCAYAGEDQAGDVILAGEASGRLGDQIRRCLGWIRSLGWGERYEGFYRIDEPIVPPAALREALVNAVAHRDYGILGSPVLLEIFSDRLVVSSPGGLPCGVTPATVLAGGSPQARNPRMVEALTARGLMAGRGGGWRLIREAMNEFNGTEPELVSEESQFTRVTLRTREA